MLKAFKEFAMKGHALDLAIGIIVGASFGKIIGSLVGDILMPPLGLLLGKVDFSNLFISLTRHAPVKTLAEAKAAGVVTINYGLFIDAIIGFVIVAFAVFMLVRLINRLRQQQQAPAAVPASRECPYCLSLIPIKARRCPHCTSSLEG